MKFSRPHRATMVFGRAPRGWVLPIFGVLCVLPVTAQAEIGPVSELIKPQLGEVSIHWQARVLEPGGVFIVYRGEGADLTEVARRAADRSGRYEIVDRAWKGGRLGYRLIYRSQDQQEHLLASSSVSLLIKGAPSATWTGPPASSLVLPVVEGLRSGDWLLGLHALVGLDFPIAPSGEPPTPPPRAILS